MRAGHPAVTSQPPAGSYYYTSSAAASSAGQQLKLTSYHVTSGGPTVAVTADTDYYKSSWRRQNLASSYDDVTAGVRCYDDQDQQRHAYVEHIYESPKFDRRHPSIDS